MKRNKNDNTNIIIFDFVNSKENNKITIIIFLYILFNLFMFKVQNIPGMSK